MKICDKTVFSSLLGAACPRPLWGYPTAIRGADRRCGWTPRCPIVCGGMTVCHCPRFLEGQTTIPTYTPCLSEWSYACLAHSWSTKCSAY